MALQDVKTFCVLFTFIICCGHGQLTTEVLWESCSTIICGTPRLNLQCNPTSKININSVTSGREFSFDKRAYENLQRKCNGMSKCDRFDAFCTQHKDVELEVNYTCVPERLIENQCDNTVRELTEPSGFITSPNYPSETNYRTCKWMINVTSGHYIHIFLHDISSPDMDKCDGLIFMTERTCGLPFPTFDICDEDKVNSTVSACGPIKIVMNPSPNPIRFWLSYYVLPVKDIREAYLYDISITCDVQYRKEFTYSAYYNRTYLQAISETPEKTNTTEVAIKEGSPREEEVVNYGLYVGLAVGVLLLLMLMIIVILYLRYKLAKAKPQGSVSTSVSQTNCSDIQKRPLPERQDSAAIDQTDEPVLQQGYSVVADELPPGNEQTAVSPTYATYAEIEECNDNGQKAKVCHKPSIDSSKRQLPEKPNDQPHKSDLIYYDIEAKDKNTEKPSTDVDAKNKKNKARKYPEFFYKKKMSNASNIYAECADVTADDATSGDQEKVYMDMSHKKASDGDVYVPHTSPSSEESMKTKDSKDKVNLTKRSQVKVTGPKGSGVAGSGEGKKPGTSGRTEGRGKSASVTSDSDSDLSMVENELYEPFESAKV